MAGARPLAKNQTLGSIEVGRGIAALLVVLYHASVHVEKEIGVKPFSSSFLFGHAGVDFFFVISGFIIFYVHHSHFGQPARLPRYFLRRVTRIFPLFWVSMVFAGLIWLAKGDPLPVQHDWATDVLLLPGESLVSVSWSLRHEMMFYVFFGLLLLFDRRVALVLSVIWAAAILSFMAFGESKSFVLNSYNLQFLMGMAAAYLAVTFAPTKQRCLMVLLGGIGLFAVVGLLENMGKVDGYRDFARILYGVPSALIVLGSAFLDRYHPVNPWRFGVFLGSLSYSIYLMHLFGIAIFNQVLGISGLGAMMSGEARMLLLSASGLAFGILAGLMIERPLQKIFRGQPAPAQLKPREAA